MAGLDEDTAEIRNFKPGIVPGLLQIPEYTRKLITVGPAEICAQRQDAGRLPAVPPAGTQPFAPALLHADHRGGGRRSNRCAQQR
ncbi:Scr1 family TA system antitoxin-like transcriptional regulator [Actinomadura verrucosospora]